MIIEFQPNRSLMSYPPQWWLYYKIDNIHEFQKISISYEILKQFIELYGYETNDIIELNKFGIDTKNIKHNRNLK